MKNLFTPGATLCPKKTPDVMACSTPLITGVTQIQRYVHIIRNAQRTKPVFLNKNVVQIGRKSEGQLGGILGKPKNF